MDLTIWILLSILSVAAYVLGRRFNRELGNWFDRPTPIDILVATMASLVLFAVVLLTIAMLDIDEAFAIGGLLGIIVTQIAVMKWLGGRRRSR